MSLFVLLHCLVMNYVYKNEKSVFVLVCVHFSFRTKAHVILYAFLQNSVQL